MITSVGSEVNSKIFQKSYCVHTARFFKYAGHFLTLYMKGLLLKRDLEANPKHLSGIKISSYEKKTWHLDQLEKDNIFQC